MIQKKFSSKKYYLLFTLYFLAFGVLIAIIVSTINYKSNLKETQNKLLSTANAEILIKRDYLKQYITQAELLVNSVAQSDLIHSYVKSKDNLCNKRVNDLFYALVNSNKDIMQLRYIDASGKEKIRVDRDRSSLDLVMVPEEKLQDKNHRYYFKETKMLDANKFWHSRVDLNIENGKIEKPLAPTLRIATKLYVDNEFQGIIISNLLFKNTIEILSHSSTFDVYLIDNDGEIIHTPDHKNSWSRYLDNNNSLQAIFPNEANNILNSSTYTSENLYAYSLGELFNNEDNLKIIFKTKTDALYNMQKQSTSSALLIAFTILIVSIPLSWIISIIPSKLQSELADSYEEIRKNAEIINKYIIITRTDKNGLITHISKKFTEITGFTLGDMLGKKHSVLKHSSTPIELYKELWITITNGQVWEHEI